MTLAEVLRWLILGLSGFAAGLALYMAWVHVSERREYWWAWTCARLGFAIVVLLVAELVYRAPAIPLEWRSGLYTVGLLLGFVGYGGIAWQERQRRRGKP